MTDNRHFTAQTIGPDGEVLNDVLVDTHTGDYVATEAPTGDFAHLLERFNYFASRMDPETGEIDTTGMSQEDLDTIARVNEMAEQLEAQQAADPD